MARRSNDRPRYRTGDRELDAAIAELVEQAGAENADLIFELIVSAVRLARDRADRGDLKIANAALKEMRYAFHVFAPYRGGDRSGPQLCTAGTSHAPATPYSENFASSSSSRTRCRKELPMTPSMTR